MSKDNFGESTKMTVKKKRQPRKRLKSGFIIKPKLKKTRAKKHRKALKAVKKF